MLRLGITWMRVGVFGVILGTAACLGGAQPEPPTNNWETDAGTALGTDAGNLPDDAGVDAGMRLDAGASSDLGSPPAPELPVNVTDSSGDNIGESQVGAGILNTYPGLVIPGVLPDAGVRDFGTADDGSTMP